MPTPGERRALIFIASIAALGVAVRGWKEIHPPDSAPLAGNRAALARQIEAVDSAVAVTSSKRKARAPRATTPPPESAPRPEPAHRARRAQPPRADTAPAAIRRPPSQPPSASRRLPSETPPSVVRRLPSQQKWSLPPVDLDIAGIEEVAAVPFIGPALARRIVTDRIDNGPFGSIAALERISGITAGFARRLEPFVTFSRAPRLGSAGERRPRSKSERRPGGDTRP
jgi:Helix-hairpin-helix motif